MAPIVSIITPCYNAESFITLTIESVLAQTYSEWELLIVDDCSTDGSYELIHKYACKDSRLKYFKTDAPSGSPALPRNIGIKNAQGKYIAFLDSDDLWLPNKLEEQVTFLEENHYDFVYSNYEKVSWEGKRANRIVCVRSTSSYWDTLESCGIPCLTVLLRKTLIEDIDFKSIPKEDYAFWLEILRRGHNAHNTGKVHALYREAKQSRSGNKYRMFKSQWYVLRKIEGVKVIPAVYFIIIFSFKGILKYLR